MRIYVEHHFAHSQVAYCKITSQSSQYQVSDKLKSISRNLLGHGEYDIDLAVGRQARVDLEGVQGHSPHHLGYHQGCSERGKGKKQHTVEEFAAFPEALYM